MPASTPPREPHFSLLKTLAYSALLLGLFLGLVELLCFAARPLYAPDAARGAGRSLSEEERRLAALALPGHTADDLAESVRFNLFENPLTQPHPELLFHVQPNPGGGPIVGYTGINALGYRGAPLATAPEGDRATRVLILGGSCAFGWAVPDYGQTLQAVLERRLAREPGGYRIYNAAQPGYSTAQGRVLFDRWFEVLRPHFVVLYFGWNDTRSRALLSDAQALGLVRRLDRPVVRLVRKTHTYAALAALFRRVADARAARREADASELSRVPIDESVANLEHMVAAIERAGARAILVPPPHSIELTLPGWRERILPFNAALREHFAGRVLDLDLAPIDYESPTSGRYYTRDGYHPNALGARFIGRRLAAAIARDARARARESATPAP